MSNTAWGIAYALLALWTLAVLLFNAWRRKHQRQATFTSMSSEELLDSVGRYVRHIETAKTADICDCDTEVHPADADLPPGVPRRMRLIEASLACPIHTREGYLLGYFRYTGREW